MRDREFAVAKRALIESTPDKTTIPESFRLVGRDALLGKRRSQYTLILPASIPQPSFDHMNVRVLGDGRILENRDEEVHSWNRNFYNWMCGYFCVTPPSDAGLFEDGKLSQKDVGNNIISSAVYWFGMYEGDVESGDRGYSADCEDDTQGVVVGLNTGATAESFDGYALDSQISHGRASGEFYYATHQHPAVTVWDDPNFLHTMTRYFDNFNSDGNAINAGEVALYARLYLYNVNYDTMVARHVPVSPVSVPFRAQLAVSLVFDLEFSKAGPLTRNCYNMIASHSMSLNLKDGTASMGDGKLNMQQTNGDINDGAVAFSHLWTYGAEFPIQASAGRDDWGIVVGAGNTAFDFDDYALDSLITSGTDPGELQYSAAEASVKVWDDPDFIASHGRTFTNGTGSNIIVREVGVINLVHMIGYGAAFDEYLYYRNVLGSPVTLAPTESLRVVYQPYVTFP